MNADVKRILLGESDYYRGHLIERTKYGSRRSTYWQRCPHDDAASGLIGTSSLSEAKHQIDVHLHGPCKGAKK